MIPCYHKRFVILIEPLLVIIKRDKLGHIWIHYFRLRKVLQIVDDITWLGGGDYILFDNMAMIQENDYISTYNCNLMIIG